MFVVDVSVGFFVTTALPVAVEAIGCARKDIGFSVKAIIGFSIELLGLRFWFSGILLKVGTT